MYYARDKDGRVTRRRSCESAGERGVVRNEIGKVTVSTVFLGLDHNFQGVGPPVLWETMVFGGGYDEAQERYTDEAASIAGHLRWVELVKGEVTT